MRRGLRGIALTAALAAALAAAMAAGDAAAQTAVTPDTAAGLTTGTTATTLAGAVVIDGGALSGGNLFHSFNQFSLGQGVTARWVRGAGDGASVANVINRVTGGAVSQIDGIIDSTALPNADFYFINPAGVVFGAGAQLNVPAAAHFSTASELRFADGEAFAIATPGGSTLSMAAPESFGFVGGEGDIAINGATLSFGADTSKASFSAANIQVTGASLLARGLDMAAVGSGVGTVKLTDPLASPLNGVLAFTGAQVVTQSVVATAPLRLGGGTVSVNATLLVSDTPRSVRGGDISISAGQVELTGGAQLSSFTRTAARGGDIRISAGRMTGDGSFVIASTASSGRGGDIVLSGDTFDLGAVTFATTGAPDASGASGAISLAAKSSFVGLGTTFLASNLGTGGAGAITLAGPKLDLGAVIAFNSTQQGTPGDISIHGGTVAMSGGAYGSAPGGAASSGALSIIGDQSLDIEGSILSAVTFNEGAAGSIALKAPRLSISGNADISVEVFGDGAGGLITLDGGTISLDRVQLRADTNASSGDKVGQIRLTATGDIDVNLSFISSDAFVAAPGGAISMTGRNVSLSESQVTSQAFRDADAGSVSLSASSALSLHNTLVSSRTDGTGDAGQINLSGKTVALTLAAQVATDTLDSGKAGTVTVVGGAVTLEDGAAISSNASAGVGDGGSVSITSDSLKLTDANISAKALSAGHGGSVTIKTGSLELNGLGPNLAPTTYITSDSEGLGDAGDVIIDASTVLVRDSAFISSDALADGAAGKVTIKSGSMTVRDGGSVSSNSYGEGHAGNVLINADTLNILGDLENSTYVASAALFGGDAGTVTINAKTLNMDGGGLISSDSLAFGRGGDVNVTAGTLSLDHFAAIRSASFYLGDAGNVRVNAGSITADNGASINSTSYSGSDGAAGLVNVTADSLAVQGGATIATSSNNPLQAGTVTIAAGTLLVTGKDSAISSENQAGNTALGNAAGEAGDAGTIRLVSNNITLSEGGEVSTNAYAGAAGDIEISATEPGRLVLQGATAPGSIQTSSGSTTGGRIVIASPLAVISNGGSILALGERRGANVSIQSRYFINSSDRINTVAVDGEFQLVAGVYDVSAGTVARDLSVIDASKVLRGQCPAVRATGQVSQLVSRPVGPYVRDPAFDVLAAPRVIDSGRPPGGGCP